jgi:hypothetical protein
MGRQFHLLRTDRAASLRKHFELLDRKLSELFDIVLIHVKLPVFLLEFFIKLDIGLPIPGQLYHSVANAFYHLNFVFKDIIISFEMGRWKEIFVIGGKPDSTLMDRLREIPVKPLAKGDRVA